MNRSCITEGGRITRLIRDHPFPRFQFVFLPCAPTDANDSDLYTYRNVDLTPVFPFSQTGVFSGYGPPASAPNLYQLTLDSAPQSWFVQLWRQGGIPATAASEALTPADANRANFYRMGLIRIDAQASESAFEMLMLRPGVALLHIADQAPFVFYASAGYQATSSLDLARQNRAPLPLVVGSVFDVQMPGLPFRQFKLTACAGDRNALQTCTLELDIGKRGSLIQRLNLPPVIAYPDCQFTSYIELVPEGLGRDQWYARQMGPDRYFGTPLETKRGQMRVALFAMRRSDTELIVSQSNDCRR